MFMGNAYRLVTTYNLTYIHYNPLQSIIYVSIDREANLW